MQSNSSCPSRLELSQLDFLPQTKDIEAVPKDVQRALLIDGLSQTAQQCVTRSGPVILRQSVPCGRLCRLDPCQNVSGKQCQLAVIVSGSLIGIQPALSGQIFADFNFEADFFVQTHDRVFVWYVTAIEITTV